MLNASVADTAAQALTDTFTDLGDWFSRRFPATLVIVLVFVYCGKLAGLITTQVLMRTHVKPQRTSGAHFRNTEIASAGVRGPEGSRLPPDPRPFLAGAASRTINFLGAGGNMSVSGARMAGHVVTGVFYVVGGIFGMQRAGLAVAPIITASAAGAFAMSLALKDTLGNCFSGLTIMLYDTVRPGDRVWLAPAKPGTDVGAVVKEVAMSRILLLAEGKGEVASSVFVVVPPQVLLQTVVYVEFADSTDDRPDADTPNGPVWSMYAGARARTRTGNGLSL